MPVTVIMKKEQNKGREKNQGRHKIAILNRWHGFLYILKKKEMGLEI